jgi:hypothetical protein
MHRGWPRSGLYTHENIYTHHTCRHARVSNVSLSFSLSLSHTHTHQEYPALTPSASHIISTADECMAGCRRSMHRSRISSAVMSTKTADDDDDVCFPILSWCRTSCLPSLHTPSYTRAHMHARHATAQTPNAQAYRGLYTCIDARIHRRRGARAACSHPSPTPSLHLFLVGGPPMTAGSLSDHFDDPLQLNPSLACRNSIFEGAVAVGGVGIC